jgi:hypothetical protein
MPIKNKKSWIPFNTSLPKHSEKIQSALGDAASLKAQLEKETETRQYNCPRKLPP